MMDALICRHANSTKSCAMHREKRLRERDYDFLLKCEEYASPPTDEYIGA